MKGDNMRKVGSEGGKMERGEGKECYTLGWVNAHAHFLPTVLAAVEECCGERREENGSFTQNLSSTMSICLL